MLPPDIQLNCIILQGEPSEVIKQVLAVILSLNTTNLIRIEGSLNCIQNIRRIESFLKENLVMKQIILLSMNAIH